MLEPTSSDLALWDAHLSGKTTFRAQTLACGEKRDHTNELTFIFKRVVH